MIHHPQTALRPPLAEAPRSERAPADRTAPSPSPAPAAPTAGHALSRLSILPPAEGAIQRRPLRGAYAEAFEVLTGRPAPGSPTPSAPVIQAELTGKYAEAAVKIGTYMGSTAARQAETTLQQAQDLGYAAPNLPGHMSSASGKDSKGEKERQKQIKAAWAKWKNAFDEWKRKRREDEDDDGPSSSGTATTSSGRRTESHKEERREVRAREKRQQYEESQEREYVAPWHGGPSAWPR